MSLPSSGAQYGAALKNREAIGDALANLIDGSEMSALEIGSGDGTDISFFAPYFPNVTWQPTEVDAAIFEAMENRIKGLNNVMD
jgi:tRNA G46 methylase TrmB